MKVNIEIECPYCNRIHVHRIDIGEPSKVLEEELKEMVEEEEMQEEEEEKN